MTRADSAVLEVLGRLPLPVVLGVLVSFLTESIARPRPLAPWHRPFAANLAHIGAWLLVFFGEFALFRRPWFAALNVDALWLALVLVNNAKFESLREPFLYQDFDYFSDAIRHPRLYVPFFGLGKLFVSVMVIGGAIGLGLWLERAVTADARFGSHVLALGVVATIGCACLAIGAYALPRVHYEPERDLERLGLVGFWLRYALDERASSAPEGGSLPLARARVQRGVAPHLVAVQSESFFDARRCFGCVDRGVLRHLDALKGRALAHGTLRVAAWGANTVRTEFAFLSGIDPKLLGVHRFNPYRRLAQGGVATIATLLRHAGYRTVCIHPYPESFYSRDTAYPALGFDEFIDIRSFAHAERVGAFVSDAAVAEQILVRLDAASSEPLFVFAITMENHGPLHLESVKQGEAQYSLREPLPADGDDLVIYLRHLRNADRMLARLTRGLQQLDRPAGLCFFGDHVPIMPRVYASLGFPDGDTDYLIWSSERSYSTLPRRLSVEQLAACFLESQGWVTGPRAPARAASSAISLH